MKKISIVSSCYNEELNLEELYRRTFEALEPYQDKYEFEYILADNGSTDGTENKLRELAARDKRIKVILNSRNFGQVCSPCHAIMTADADAVIAVASDLQDPPELLPKLIQKWEEGAKVVLLQKTSTNESVFMSKARKLYYKVLNKIADNGIDLAQNCTGSGLIDRLVLNYMKELDDPYPFYRGLICEAGFERAYVQFDQPKRKNGKTANNLYTLYDLGMLGVVKYSKLPLRVMAIVGFFMSMITFLFAIFYFIWKLVNWSTFEFGIAPIIISIMFIGSVQLFCFGILGEYLAAIYTRVNKKPLVVEKERINF